MVPAKLHARNSKLLIRGPQDIQTILKPGDGSTDKGDYYGPCKGKVLVQNVEKSKYLSIDPKLISYHMPKRFAHCK